MTKNLDQEGLSSIKDNYSLYYIDIRDLNLQWNLPYLEAIDVLKKLKMIKKSLILLTIEIK